MTTIYHSKYQAIPEELKALPHWCAFTLQKRGDKLTKIPVNANNGALARSNDENTWATFETAVDAIDRYDCAGIGFFFKPPYFGIDIDNIGSEIERYKQGDHEDNIVSEFIEMMQSYAEYSVSGNGLHIICKGELPPGGRRKGNIEMYDSGRFFAMTGNSASSYNRINTDEYGKINYLHNKYISTSEIKKKPSEMSESGNNIPVDDIIKLAFNSKGGLRFRVLYEGGWDEFYSSQSEADLSFCNDLAFWTNRDAEKMDAIFRQSALYRDKWDQKRGSSTYGETTINRAIADCTNVFKPDYYRDDDFQIFLDDHNIKKVGKESFSYDDTGNAQRLQKYYGDVIRYSYTRKNWYFFDGKRWVIDNQGMIKTLADRVIDEMKNEPVFVGDDTDEEKAKRAFQRHIKNTRNSRGKMNMMKECEHLLPIAPDIFDKNPFLLNVQNGYLDLQTGTLHEHDKDLFFTKIANAEYTDNIDCPLWMQFLDQIFDGDQELIKYVQKIVGYSLSGSIEEQVLFILYGNGRNGKSVFLDIISELMGNYATSVQPQSIMVKNFSNSASSDIAKMDGARLVTTTESNEGVRLDEGLVKQLTGSDKITARFLYENEFEFFPQFKLWMATNHKPIIRGTDDGIWRRLCVIPFSVQIPADQVDKSLKYKLRCELRGILKWAVDGFLLWRQEGLEWPKAVLDQSMDYRNEMDILCAFIDECCLIKDGGRVPANKLYQVYKTWAKENEEYLMSNTKFGREMSKKFQKIKSNTNYYIGITLKEEYEKTFFRLSY